MNTNINWYVAAAIICKGYIVLGEYFSQQASIAEAYWLFLMYFAGSHFFLFH
jgi:hypothetical protein